MAINLFTPCQQGACSEHIPPLALGNDCRWWQGAMKRSRAQLKRQQGTPCMVMVRCTTRSNTGTGRDWEETSPSWILGHPKHLEGAYYWLAEESLSPFFPISSWQSLTTSVWVWPHKYTACACLSDAFAPPCKSSPFSSLPLILALFSSPHLVFSLCVKTNGFTTCWKAAKGSGEVTNGNAHTLIYYDSHARVHKVNWVNREGLCAKLFIHFSNWGIFYFP